MDTFTAADDVPLWGLTITEPAGPADHLDRALTELLDVQDDIAETVMWLAEHWRLDLPELTLSLGIPADGYLLRVMACCSRDELGRVAELIDAPVTEAEPHSGARWFHARRRFGTVLLDAFTSEDLPERAARYLAAYQAKATDAGPEAGAA